MNFRDIKYNVTCLAFFFFNFLFTISKEFAFLVYTKNVFKSKTVFTSNIYKNLFLFRQCLRYIGKKELTLKLKIMYVPTINVFIVSKKHLGF